MAGFLKVFFFLTRNAVKWEKIQTLYKDINEEPTDPLLCPHSTTERLPMWTICWSPFWTFLHVETDRKKSKANIRFGYIMTKTSTRTYMCKSWLSRRHSGEESACQCQETHEICKFDPWVWKILWHRKWQQYCCPESYMDRGAWRATVHGATKSQTWLSTRAQWKYTKLIKLTFIKLVLGYTALNNCINSCHCHTNKKKNKS